MKYKRWRGGSWNKRRGLFVYFDPNDVIVSTFAYARRKLYFMKREKSAEAMRKQIFQIQKYDLVS